MPSILILDDRVTNQRILGRLAASVEPGAEVHTFGDPLQALAWVERHGADLIITDFKMPHLDGAEFTRRIRQIPTAADVPVVVVTVYDDRELRLLALEAGATDFLLAPVDHVEFRTRVRNLLTLRRHQVEALRTADLLRRDLEVSERLRSALARESREALAQLIDTVPALISACDREGRLLFVNAAQAKEAGALPSDLVGRDRAALFGAERAALVAELDEEVFVRGEALPGFEETVTAPDGAQRHYFTTKAPMRDAQGQVVAVLSTSIDITARKQAEERLLHLARHDPLTALPNRAFLSDRLRERCARGRRSDEGFALHFLDLTRFKAVNDALGHQAGDRLLVLVARRLRNALRQADLLARLGGDDFAILQPDARSAAEAAHLAERVLEALERPFRIMGRSITVAASLGITLFPQDAADPDELLRNADLAMYRTKRAGGGFGFFDPGMEAAARDALQLESELREALARGEFELLWQPQVSLRDGCIKGAEALLRWRHPRRGLIGPDIFLPLAEEIGLITPITQWVLRSACAQGMAWRSTPCGALRISANLSPRLFRRHNVAAMVRAALAETGLPHARLDLEITERVLVENMAETADILQTLRAAGVSFSIDDFGTGYSSLAYVKNLPVQRLKIDRAFVAGLGQDRADAAIVGAVIGLAHGLGMEVVAEGVESPEQLSALRRLGCDEVQGFIVCKPLPAEELQLLLEKGFSLPEAA